MTVPGAPRVLLGPQASPGAGRWGARQRPRPGLRWPAAWGALRKVEPGALGREGPWPGPGVVRWGLSPELPRSQVTCLSSAIPRAPGTWGPWDEAPRVRPAGRPCPEGSPDKESKGPPERPLPRKGRPLPRHQMGLGFPRDSPNPGNQAGALALTSWCRSRVQPAWAPAPPCGADAASWFCSRSTGLRVVTWAEPGGDAHAGDAGAGGKCRRKPRPLPVRRPSRPDPLAPTSRPAAPPWGPRQGPHPSPLRGLSSPAWPTQGARQGGLQRLQKRGGAGGAPGRTPGVCTRTRSPALPAPPSPGHAEGLRPARVAGERRNQLPVRPARGLLGERASTRGQSGPAQLHMILELHAPGGDVGVAAAGAGAARGPSVSNPRAGGAAAGSLPQTPGPTAGAGRGWGCHVCHLPITEATGSLLIMWKDLERQEKERENIPSLIHYIAFYYSP